MIACPLAMKVVGVVVGAVGVVVVVVMTVVASKDYVKLSEAFAVFSK